MSYLFWQKIAETPWWQYVIFFYFLWLSYLATKPKQIPINRLLISAIIFLCFSVLVIFFFINRFTIDLILFWVATSLIGMIIGWLQFRFYQITIIPNEKVFNHPGSYFPFIFVVILIVTKFYHSDLFNFNLELITVKKYAVAIMSCYGLLIGTSMGKFVYVYRALKLPKNVLS